jgi:hypothetical protein
MLLRRVIQHFRKQEFLPLIPAQAGIQRATTGAQSRDFITLLEGLDPGLRRDERIMDGVTSKRFFS